MFRRSSFAPFASILVVTFCIACLSGNRFGGSRAHAKTQIDPGTGVVVGTPIDEGSNGPCPPPTYSYQNNTGNEVTMTYECSGSSSTSVTVGAGKKLVFDGDQNGSCTGCDMGDDNCTCIECPLTRLTLHGTGTLFSSSMQEAYFTAYRLDLAAETVMMPVPAPAQVLSEYGGPPKHQWAIPVLNQDRELVGWEFTTTEPRFFVEDGEVVIRSKYGKVIGGPEGLAVDDD